MRPDETVHLQMKILRLKIEMNKMFINLEAPRSDCTFTDENPETGDTAQKNCTHCISFVSAETSHM
jgi:hypothetical protein